MCRCKAAERGMAGPLWKGMRERSLQRSALGLVAVPGKCCTCLIAAAAAAAVSGVKGERGEDCMHLILAVCGEKAIRTKDRWSLVLQKLWTRRVWHCQIPKGGMAQDVQ